MNDSLTLALREAVREIVKEELATQHASTPQLDDTTLAYSYKRAIDVTGVHRTTLSEAVRRGELRPTRLGRHVVFQRDDLEKWLKSKTGNHNQRKGSREAGEFARR